jgi:hypothetical protein
MEGESIWLECVLVTISHILVDPKFQNLCDLNGSRRSWREGGLDVCVNLGGWR